MTKGLSVSLFEKLKAEEEGAAAVKVTELPFF